jgi:hypothetical protein
VFRLAPGTARSASPIFLTPSPLNEHWSKTPIIWKNCFIPMLSSGRAALFRYHHNPRKDYVNCTSKYLLDVCKTLWSTNIELIYANNQWLADHTCKYTTQESPAILALSSNRIGFIAIFRSDNPAETSLRHQHQHQHQPQSTPLRNIWAAFPIMSLQFSQSGFQVRSLILFQMTDPVVVSYWLTIAHHGGFRTLYRMLSSAHPTR